MRIFIAYAVLYLFVFIFGTVIGSFMNVVIYRVPRKISIAKGRSFCPACSHKLGAADLVPLISWIGLRGKCRYCKAPISPRYPIVELLGGAVAVLCVALKGFTPMAAVAFCAIMILMDIAFIDADTMEIPNGLVIALAVPAIAAAFLAPQIGIVERAIGIAAISVPMLLITLAIKGAFGGGDIKLMAAAGFLLGWKLSLLAMFFALITGGAYGVYLLAAKKKGKKDHFAFGPFLASGCAFSLLIGQVILDWYINFML